MKKPTFTLQIGAEPVEVIATTGEQIEEIAGVDFDGDIYGYSVSFPCYRSFFNEELTLRTQASTSLHEILHNISAIYGLNLSEAKVRALEQGLCQAFGNKEYAKFLFSNLTNS